MKRIVGRNRITVFLMCLAIPHSVMAAQVLIIDPTHSDVGFSISNLGVNTVRGRFTQFAGQITYDVQDPLHSHVQATIQAGSIDTENEKRDHHLKSKDFFDTAMFPVLAFQSQTLEKAGDAFRMTGILTIRGQSKPVSMVVHFRQTTGTDSKVHLLADAETTIDRRDFGLTYGNSFMIGHPVHIHLRIDAF